MKTATALTAMLFGLAATSLAADFKGFVQDEACSTKPAMKGNAACAEKCIKGGDKAVLVTPDGKVYKIAEQDKITAHAGHNVTITGNLKGDTISVEKVTMN
jgi:hypothetical protein